MGVCLSVKVGNTIMPEDDPIQSFKEENESCWDCLKKMFCFLFNSVSNSSTCVEFSSIKYGNPYGAIPLDNFKF